MLRRSLGGWSLVVALFFAAALPAIADDEADKIKGGIEWYFQSVMAGYPGVELRHEIEVTPLEGEYELAVKNLAIADKESSDAHPLGDVFARVKPLDNGDYRFHSVRVPEEIRVTDPANAANSVVVRLGLEKFEGILSPRAGYASAHDFLAKDFSVRLNAAPTHDTANGSENLIVQIAELTSTSAFQEPKENAVDQEMTFNLRDLSADYGGGAVLRIGKSKTDIAFSANDVIGMIRAQEKLNEFTQNIAEADDQAELAFMRSAIDIWASMSKFVQRAEFENITFDSPGVKVGIQDSEFAFEALKLDEDLSSQDMLISARGFFVSLPANPGMDTALQMLPRRWTLPVKFQRVPLKAILDDTKTLLSGVSSPDEINQGGPQVEVYTDKIGQRFREAGTTILLDGQSIESDVVTATMDGLLKVDPDNPIGIEGNVSAQAIGLMQLFEQAQSIPDPQAAQQVMQGAMLLLSTGETVPGGQVPSVTDYRFEFTPEGAVILNGNQMHPPAAPAE